MNSASLWNKELSASWHKEPRPRGVKYMDRVGGLRVGGTSPSLGCPVVTADSAMGLSSPPFLCVEVFISAGWQEAWRKRKNNKQSQGECKQANPLCQRVYPEEWRVMIECSDH